MGSGASSEKLSQTGNVKQLPSEDEGGLQKVDSRLPFPQFRELFTLKNYWKTVRRTEKESGKSMFAKYLKQNPENIKLYPKLKNVDITKLSPETADPGFETMAANYLKLFDDVITAVEETPADCSDACSRLIAVGKIHRAKVSTMSATQFQDMEKPFIDTISEILQDRFNDKVENLFRKFFQFCLKYLIEGLNS